MRKLVVLCAALGALNLTFPAAATVVPPTPEQIIMMDKRRALEERARAAIGDTGIVEKLRDWRKSWGFILVEEKGSRPPKLIIKDEYGWYELRPGETRRVSAEVGHELNRLLHRPDLWAEDAYNFHSPCKGAPRHFVIMHAGQETFGRLGCGPKGLASRAAETARALRPLPGAFHSIAPPGKEHPDPVGASPAYFEASRQISGQLFEMAAAWERKTLAGFVEPYAQDVILEGPFGIYQGRKMVVDWARHLQNWDAPYSEGDKRLRVERIVSENQEAKNVFYTRHEWRWEEAGTPVRQTFSTMWRNQGGLWRIAHEKISEVKPVTGERVSW